MPSRRPDRRDFLRGPANLVRSGTGDASSKGAAADTYLIQFTRDAMGCQFEVLLNADQAKDDSETALEVLDHVEFLEHKLSLYQPHSELCQLNRAAVGEEYPVDDDLWPLLAFAEQLHDETAGAYDITMSPLARLWGFHHRNGRLPSPLEIANTLTSVGMHLVQLDHQAHTVTRLHEKVELSFASLGKGYALDRCDRLLAASGAHDYLLHGGYSSMLGRGRRLASAAPAGSWCVALRDPDRAEHRLGRIRLDDSALGTSGLANQSFLHQGRRYGHLLDPRTGRPVDHLVSATAVAPQAMWADALATAFFVMGRQGTEDYCRNHPEVGAVLVAPGKGPGRRETIVIGRAAEHWLPD